MPTVSATGCLSTPLVRLQDLIAESAAWQAWTDKATTALARERVHLTRAKDPENVERPFALIEWDEQSFGQSAWSRGALMLVFEANVPEQYKADNSDPAIDFYNHVGAVLDQVSASAEDPTVERLFTDRDEAFVMQGPAQMSDPQEDPVYMQIRYRVNFGIGS